MALLRLGCPAADCSLERLHARLASTEVWSIELAFLLTEYAVRCEFLTTSTSAIASPRRRAQPFYAATLAEDGARVGTLLARAAADGVHVRRASLSANELWNTLRDDDHLVIALVDARALRPAARGAEAEAEAEVSPSPRGSAGFYGHFVLLVGLDDATASFVVKDPARAEEEAHGTDEDLIVVPLDQDDAPTAPDGAAGVLAR